jgi:peptide/nickel transport system permease protein
MAAYIARRLILAFFTIWVISVAAFVIIELPPGDTIDRMFDRTTRTHGEAVAEEMLEALRLRLGLDEPKYVRYGKWMGALLQGDLGQTMVPYGGLGNQRAVKEVIGDRLFTTIALTGFTVLVTWTFAIPVGIYSAVRQHSVGDYVFTFVGFTGLAVPDFLLGLVLMYIAFAYFDQSVGGLFSADYAGTSWLEGGVNWGKVFDMINHLWLPAIVLGTSGTAGLIRVMRNNLLDELGKPYVVTARAKGAVSWRLILKYPVRVAINPMVSTIGWILPEIVSGSVITALVLSLPTVGPLLYRALLFEDMFLASTLLLFLNGLTIVGTFISDILLMLVDPRIRLTGGTR